MGRGEENLRTQREACEGLQSLPPTQANLTGSLREQVLSVVGYSCGEEEKRILAGQHAVLLVSLPCSSPEKAVLSKAVLL